MGSPAQVTVCPQCSHSNPFGNAYCGKCRSQLQPQEDLTVTGFAGDTWAAAPSSLPMKTLEPGMVLGGRYEIQKPLGEGGMGAVYRARDRELDRVVAIKIIRPELAGHASILARFKQELILARQISHRNVIRIFDLGAADGFRYITMEYVEGRDLHEILAERKFTVKEAVQIIRQAARALEAAHAENVIHRDLKPHNIMVGENGRVWVMDFGLARSMETTGLTQTGALMGTPAYMSPEQAKGETLDARSDIFSLGLIFYELLTGVVPFRAETVLASLLKRTQGPADPPQTLNPEVPPEVGAVVLKALAIDQNERYQTARDFASDLDLLSGDTPTRAASSVILSSVLTTAAATPAATAPAAPPPRRRTALYAAAAVALAIAGGAAWWKFTSGSKPPAAQQPVSILIADLKNNSGDTIFNGTLEPVIALALEQASFITTLRRDQAMRAAVQLQPDAKVLDEPLARLVAVREGVNAVVAGTIAHGSSYEVALRVTDAVTGKEIATVKRSSSSKEGVLSMAGALAGEVRGALGDQTPESVRMAAAETFTSGSLESAHAYAAAQDLRFAGKADEAIAQYRRALDMDPNFGSAHAALAAVYANTGRREEAVAEYRLAMARIDRMTDREKYRTRGAYYLAVMEPQKAIDEFGSLVKQFPADTMGHSSLAFAYYLQRDMARALDEGRQALKLYPKNVPYRNNVALYALYAGEFATAETESRAALEANPAYVKAYLTQALSLIAQRQPAKALATYEKLRKVSPLGDSLGAMGVADLALYESRPKDAIAVLQAAIATDLAAKNTGAAAKKWIAIADAHRMLGEKGAALAAAEKAVALARDAVLFPAARLYLELAAARKAEPLAAELGNKFESIPRAFSKAIQGGLLLEQGRYRDAIPVLQESIKISDTWMARYDLGRAYLEAKAYTEADSELDRCLKRAGEASDVFLDEVPTFRYLPPVHYQIGRLREAMNSPAAGEAYKTFLAMKAAAAQDAMVGAARKKSAR